MEIRNVLVLLSTYNGEKFLKDQISSLLNQQQVNTYILIRDDGSTDRTIEILRESEKRYANIEVVYGSNIGCSKSFDTLIGLAVSKLQVFDYYAFCDQDDVWDDDKLVVAVRLLDLHRNKEMRLYSSSYRVVDTNLNYISTSISKYKHTLGESLLMINILGCTQVFSRSLLESSYKRIEYMDTFFPNMPNHDGWNYLVAIVNRALIIYDENPHLNYRQHENNVVGANQSTLINRFYRMLKSKGAKSLIAKILHDVYGDSIDRSYRELLYKNSNYRKSFKNKFDLFFSKDMVCNSLIVNIAYRILIVFNYF